MLNQDTPAMLPVPGLAACGIPPGELAPGISTEAPIAFLPNGTRLFEYAIEGVLGHGGFGITYLARDTLLDNRVAIKEYLPSDLAVRSGTHVSVRSRAAQKAFAWGLQQFLREAQTLARFAHPNLIAVRRFFRANASAYFVMEYAEGETLGSLLKREPSLTEERLRGVLVPIMGGLEVVHRAGVLHRDIKPENILQRQNGSPVLIDFGAARQKLGSITRSVMCALSPGYAPIEQYGTSDNQGPWTDVYALGAVAYRAVSGSKPVDAVNRVHDDPLVAAGVIGYGRFPPAFLNAVDWALAVNPEDRPRSVADFRSALDGGLTRPRPKAAASARFSEATTAPAPDAAAAKGAHPAQESLAPAAPSPPEPAEPMRPAPRRWRSAAIAVASLFALSLAILAFLSKSNVAPPVDGPAAGAEQGPPQPAAEPFANPARSPELRKKPEAGLAPVSQMEPLTSFRHCPYCPTMVVLPAGTFQMGTSNGADAKRWEAPVHAVTLRKPIAMSAFEITVEQWQYCARAGACKKLRTREVTGAAAQLPVVNVTWGDARAYADWLTRLSGRQYRLPSEAEWEYAARNDPHTALADGGSVRPSWFGLQGTTGNVWEWTQDCWRDSYEGAPRDGKAVDAPNCGARTVRGGSWRNEQLRSVSRSFIKPDKRNGSLGFRVAAQ